MRQVPTYGIIGNGRVARHFCHYFTLLELPTIQWDRCCDDPTNRLNQLKSNATRILILISDDSIESFIREFLSDYPKEHLIHCSGCLITDLAVGAHPLMTFGPELYDLSVYRRVPFVVDQCAKNFNTLLPFFPNPQYQLLKSKKDLYHSLCVLSGNFTCLLWQKFFHALEEDLQLPKEIGFLYLQQVMKNLLADSRQALTGPLVRGDQQTIEKNIEALSADPFQKVYQAFVCAYYENNQTVKNGVTV